MAEDAKPPKSSANENTSREDGEKASLRKLSITMDKRVELAVEAGFALLGAFILIEARHIRLGSTPDPITSRGLPSILGIFLIIAGIIMMAMRLLTWSVLPGHLVPAEGHEDEEGYPASWVPAFSGILASMLWAFLLKPMGYLIDTELFLMFFMLIMGVRSWVRIIAFATICTLATWYSFSQLLQINLPLGPLLHLARSLGLAP